MVVRMGDALLGFVVIAAVLGFILVTLYGSALILTEHFWIGVLLLLFLSPIFFIWAFFKGLTGK
jgi:heme A synthase